MTRVSARIKSVEDCGESSPAVGLERWIPTPFRVSCCPVEDGGGMNTSEGPLMFDNNGLYWLKVKYEKGCWDWCYQERGLAEDQNGDLWM